MDYKMDEMDWLILNELKKDGRRQWREIGEEIHMTGQAVGERIKKMVAAGIIEGFSVKLSSKVCEKKSVAFVTVFMSSNDHPGFLSAMDSSESVLEVHRISGRGCYMVKALYGSQKELEKLLEIILQYGNYQVSISIGQHKG